MIGRSSSRGARRVPARALSLLLFATLLLGLSCRLPFAAHSPSQKGSSVTVSFRSSMTESPSRTVVPPADLGITSISVTVSDAAGSVIATASVTSVSGSCTISEIVPGTLTVTAVASGGSGVVAEGSATVSVAAGASAAVHIDLLPGTSATGSFSFTMVWPRSTGASFVECSLTGSGNQFSDGRRASADTNGADYSFTFAGTGIPSGAYDLSILFRSTDGGTPLGAFVESVNIFDNVVSNTWLGQDGSHLSARTFRADELKDSMRSLSQLVITGAGMSRVYSPTSDPPLAGDATIEMGKIDAPSITFTPAIAADTGQTISYTWNGAGPVQVDTNTASAPLELADGDSGNTLVIRVTASSGDNYDYTVNAVRAYSLSYEGNGATGGDVPAGGLYAAGETVKVSGQATLSRDGWRFSGWRDNFGASYAPGTTFAMGSQSLVMAAQWIELGEVVVDFSPPAYRTIVFTYGDSAAPVSTLRVERGGPQLFIAYGGSGSTATGWTWYLDGKESGTHVPVFSFSPTTNGRYVISCTALYDGAEYAGSLTVTVSDPLKVSYDGNGADSGAAPAATGRQPGEKVSVEPNSGGLARSGYTFAGWSTSPDGTGKTLQPGDTFPMGEASVTLFAVWSDSPPAPVAKLSLQPGPGSVTLSWAPPADADFAYVVISYGYQGGTSSSVTVPKGNSSRTIAGLTAGTLLVFDVTAYDRAGNASAKVSGSATPGAL